MHVEVADWIAGQDAAEIEIPFLDPLAQPRMDRQHHDAVTSSLSQKCNYLTQRLAVLGAFGSVDRRKRKAPPGDPQPIKHWRASGSRSGEQRRVIHHISDVVDATNNTLHTQIADRGRSRT